ncbi:hypothetical protein HN873_032457 [Arachis hypogaea]
MLDISENSRIEAPLLQYLSIMIQNMDNEHAICKTAKIFRPINSVMHEILCYAEMLSNMAHRIQMASYWYLIQYIVLTLHLADYCFSNGYINSIILHPYELDGGDLAPYYMSFLRAVSGKINRDTLCLLVNVHGDAVVSFPLYTEALRFAHHEEKMIQTVVRTIALNIYNVSDEMVYKFIMTPPVSDYFSVMVGRLREMCIPLDAFLHEKRGSDLSAITSLYILSRLLQVVGGRSMINNVAGVILYHVLNLNARTLSEGNASDSSGVISISSWCIVLD